MSPEQAVPVTPSTHAPKGIAYRFFNRFALALAGTQLVPFWAILSHRGRRSGKVYRIPVAARPTADGFVIPMPWGEQTDWYRNVIAAGGCELRWKGRIFRLVAGEVIDNTPANVPGFSRFQRTMMRRLGITRVLQLHTKH